MELAAVHCIPYGDLATSPTCHCIPYHPITDRKAAGRLGGRLSRDAHGGHPAYMRTVPNRRPQGGVRGEPGSDLSKPGAPRKATDDSAVDHEEGYRGHTTARREVQKDGGKGDGGAAHQAPGGPSTNSGQPGLVPGPPTGARPG